MDERPCPQAGLGVPAIVKHVALMLALGASAALLAGSAAAEPASVGIYRDTHGTSCSFSDAGQGLVTAHVVFRPDARGFRGTRFSAPVPSCFGAVWIQDLPTERTHLIGDSQTGVSVASSWCEDAPVQIMQILYYQLGATAPCCEYPVLADPYVGIVEAIDCNQETFVASGATAYFNANESCECSANVPPATPHNPSPVDAEAAVRVYTPLTWSGGDPDSNLAAYDLYLGTDPNPPLHAPGLTQPSFQPESWLTELTTFYWRVVARDEVGIEASGPVWSFTTRLTNSPPEVPHTPQPPNGSTGNGLLVSLSWQCHDIDAEPLIYDVYLGTSTTPPLYKTGLRLPSYSQSVWDHFDLTYGTNYYWRVVARDPQGHETSSPLWGFRTRPANWPPNPPFNPSPANGSVGSPVNGALTWSCTDPDVGDYFFYDVYFGTAESPPKVASGNLEIYSYTALVPATTYYWKIVARDNRGAQTVGPTWSFTTAVNAAPLTPSVPSPAHDALNLPLTTPLSWQCSDPELHGISYDVYFGTSPAPPLVESNHGTKSFAPGTLQFTTKYYWRVVARDQYGLVTNGPTWSFTTKAEGPPPAPSNPFPPVNALTVPMATTLTWVCTDPDGQALAFDIYFGASATPPLVATNVATRSYAPGVLQPVTRYYWRVVARDPDNHTVSGPTWYYTTDPNAAPSIPSNPSPGNNSETVAAPVLTWTGSDPDGQPLTFEVYLGDVSPPPLVASALTTPSYAPGVLAAGTTYYWKVVAYDGFLYRSGPTWSFTTVNPGDVNKDGQITTADAKCAMDRYLLSGSCGSDAAADVDCNGAITPSDARCIHRRAIAMSCPLCGEGVSPSAPALPGLGVTSTWEWNDTLYCRLAVSNVPSFESFGFTVTSGPAFIRAQRRGITNDFVVLKSQAPGAPGSASKVGGYTLTGTDASSQSEFIDLRFIGDSGAYWVRIDNYADDLAGAAPLEFYLPGGAIPVFFTRFDAASRRDGVEISWQLQADEAMESFALYRRADGAPPAEIARGEVTGTTGRHLDTSVSAGSTYEYELMIRSADGDEFRSQVRRVTVAPLELTLGSNHPNPFNPQTTIPYSVPAGGAPVRVRLVIYDASGRLVRVLVDEDQSGGAREVVWRGDDASGRTVTSGVYFCVLQVDKERRTRKLVLLK